MIKVLKAIAFSSLVASVAIYASSAEAPAAAAKLIDINKGVENAPDRMSKEDLGNKKEVTEEALGLRKTNLYEESKDTEGVMADYSRPAPGQSTRFARAYVNAPPMIPHSVDGLLPITQSNNSCLGCHMPEVAAAVKATPIPKSHFINYRPTTVYKDGELVKEGQTVGTHGKIGNTSDIKLAEAKELKELYQGRYNCSQCHAPQAKIDTVVGNTFQPDGMNADNMGHSNLVDVMNEGVK